MTDSLHTIDQFPDLEIAYVGPHLSTGPLPSLFYFSLSAKDSLCLNPFNQPVSYLSSLPIRIFSMTLPGHENAPPPTQAFDLWASGCAKGENPIGNFITKVKSTVDTLLDQGALIPDKLGIAGLSRGAFIAAHAAAVIPQFRWILGFAPLTKLDPTQTHSHPLIKSLDLEHLSDKLFDRSLRFYIGNLDTRVGVRNCFDFIEKLSQTALANKIRSPAIELIIGPSIGRDGHGTTKAIFHEGAQWIAEKLGCIDVV